MKVIVEIIEQKDGNVAVGIKTDGLALRETTKKEAIMALTIRDHLRANMPAIGKKTGGKDCFDIPGNPATTGN